MSEVTYTAVATSTAEGRNGGRATSDELVAGAHQVCPYSKATRGNIEVAVDATVA
jgi:osmotically inducible protein OsmC